MSVNKSAARIFIFNSLDLGGGGSSLLRRLSREQGIASIRLLRGTPHDVEVGILDLRFLHDASRGRQRRLAGFVSSLPFSLGDRLAACHAVRRRKAGFNVLRTRHRGGQSGGEAEEGEAEREANEH